MQRKFLLVILVTTFLSFLVKGNKKKDIEAIKGMCGCMDIEFKFAETFSPNKDYKYYDNFLETVTENNQIDKFNLDLDSFFIKFENKYLNI